MTTLFYFLIFLFLCAFYGYGYKRGFRRGRDVERTKGIWIAYSGHVFAREGEIIQASITRPANWWEALKDSILPKWLKPYIGIKIESITTQHQNIYTCPHLDLSDRDLHLAWLGQSK